MTSYMPRMPQVGKRYVLQIRNDEVRPCRCGYVPGERLKKWNGAIVTVLSTDDGGASCAYCGETDINNAYVGVNLPGITTKTSCVFYTWLEPITEPQP